MYDLYYCKPIPYHKRSLYRGGRYHLKAIKIDCDKEAKARISEGQKQQCECDATNQFDRGATTFLGCHFAVSRLSPRTLARRELALPAEYTVEIM